MNRIFKKFTRNLNIKNKILTTDTCSISSTLLQQQKFMPLRNFSVLEAKFIQEVQTIKHTQNVNKQTEIYDILEISIKDSKPSSEFKVLLLDDPKKFFDILGENFIEILKHSSNPTSKSIINFVKILEYINITFEYVLLYENCLLTFNHFKIFVNLLIENILASSNNKILEIELEKFLSDKMEKLEYKTNIYVLYLLNTILRHKLIYKHKFITLFEDFQKKDIHSYFYKNNDNKSILDIRIESLELFSLNFLKNYFTDFVIMSKKKNFKTFLIKNTIVEDTNYDCTPELIVELCFLMSMSYTLLYNELGGLKVDSFSKFLLSIDEVISLYIISPQASHQVVYTLLHNFFYPKIIYKLGGGINFINTFNSLCRAFIIKGGEQNNFHFFLLRLFLKENHKSSFTTLSVNNSFKACYFYIHDYYSIEKNYKNCDSFLLLDVINLLTSVKFDVNKKLIDEFMSRVDEFLNNNLFEHYANIIITTIAYFDNPDHSVIKKIMTHDSMKNNRCKRHINIGFYALEAKFNDYEVWKTWVEKMMNTSKFPIFYLNNFDTKMLKMMKSMFNITNPEINKIFGPYVDKLKLKEDKGRRNFHRYFHSNNLDRGSLLELPFTDYLNRMNIIYKTQFYIPENEIDVDYLLGENIVIEICGPSHYYINNKFKMDHKTRIKKEVLESKGYLCFFINWIKLPSDFNLQGNYILDLIKSSVSDEQYQNIFRRNKK